MDISFQTKLFTSEEVANFLRISTHQVNRLCRLGKLSRIKISERTYRITEEAVLEYVREAALAGAMEHPNGNQTNKWHLQSKLHFHRSNDGGITTIPPFAWDEE